MSSVKRLPLKDSIGFHLLKLVFSIYIIIAVIVTIAHMGIEYFNVKSMVKQDLKLYQTTFEPAIADSLWDLDENRLKTISPGILTLPSIVGLEIHDLNDSAVVAIGTTSNASRLEQDPLSDFDKLFFHEFDIHYKNEGEDIKVGKAYFYSSTAVVLKKVKAGFLLILVNAIIKTIALWFIFLVVVRPILIKPLEILTTSVRLLTLDRAGNFNVDIKSKKNNELKILEESFNRMAKDMQISAEKLAESNVSLQQSKQHLELLLDGAGKMAESAEKLTSISIAAQIIDAAILKMNTASIDIEYSEYRGRETLFFTHQLNLDKERVMTGFTEGDFSTECYSQTYEKTQGRIEKTIVHIDYSKIRILIWHDTYLLATLSLSARENIIVTDVEEQFILALAQYLALSLGGISQRNSLEIAVQERTIELLESKRSLETKASELEQSNTYKSQFLANMSHEIRTPMNAIMGFSLRGMKNNHSENTADYFEKIYTASDALLVVINDVLDFSKISDGHIEVESVEFNIYALLESVYDIIYEASQKKNLELFFIQKMDFPEMLWGDPSRIKQILLNLLSNAVKFTEEGEVYLEVSATSIVSNKLNFIFSVRDSGIGIASDNFESIFDSFSQADSSTTRLYGGTGLGLAISKKLSQLMGGYIGITSELGKGSQFDLNIDLQLPTYNETYDVSRANAVLIKILMFESKNKHLQLLSQTLKNINFEVVVHKATETIEAKLLSDFDLIFLEGDVADVTKKSFIERLSTEDKNKCVVILNNQENNENNLFFKQKNIVHILTAPIFIRDIYGLISTESLEQSEANSICEAEDDDWWLDGRYENKKILLVEDSVMNQELAKFLLEDAKIIVTIVNNGQECLDILKDHNFDVILMDIQMPIMDGLTAAQDIRKQAKFNNLPIIALSAHALKEDYKKSLDAGMNEHISKPIDCNELYNTLKKWL